MSINKPNYLVTADTTEEVIRNRLLSHVDDSIDKNEGSYIYDAHAPVAIELVFVRMALQRALALGFAQTTDLEHLIMRAAEHGVSQKKATKATGTITITGNPGTIIPLGLRLATEADAEMGIESIYFATTAEAVLDDKRTVDLPIEAEELGTSGNVGAGAIVVLVETRKNIQSVTNAKPTTGGTDDEDYESLLARYLAKVRNPGTSGNMDDYHQWALAVDGVGGERTIPLWAGEGTVKLVIVDENKAPASPAIIERVRQAICVNDGTGDRKAPIGASVTVVPAEAVPINIVADVILSRDAGVTIRAVQEAFVKVIGAYLKRLAFETSTIRYARIGAYLLEQEAVVDYNSLTINGHTDNIDLTDDQVGVLGTVSLIAT